MSHKNKKELIIAKFGGTSVADFTAMSNSADVVLSNPNVRMVVLSASAGVTNLLIALADGCNQEKRAELVEKIQAIQYQIINHLPNNQTISHEIDRQLSSIAKLSEAASLATSKALCDELVSHGELMSTLLFVEVLRFKKASAEWFDVRNVMITDDNFGKATPDSQKLKELCDIHLTPRVNDTLAITQGFIGCESTGKTTTLGRGGSDYTAALLGEALGATRIDIWTDVPGIYTTDPRVVPTAQRISQITFEETAEMATFGAKILHPATLIPAINADIPVYVGSSKDPKAGGTTVCYKTTDKPLFRALALRRAQTLLTLHSLNMLHARGFLAEVFSLLAKHKISVDLITTSEVRIALTLDTASPTTSGGSLLTKELLDELSVLCRVEVEEDLSLVAIIGNQLSHSSGVSKQVFGALDAFSIRMACYGASSHNICLLLPSADAEKAVQTLHKSLFGC